MWIKVRVKNIKAKNKPLKSAAYLYSLAEGESVILASQYFL